MCGIAGIVHRGDRHPAPDLDALHAMLGALRHRGPDEFGVYRDRHAGLAHARLSIVDLQTGQQPLANEDGTRWIIFNGEVFNYVELRDELAAHGHRFRTHSDTEVILHAYEQWGPGCFERFNGQWALAIWDARARMLVLARDRVGVRPLYVCERGERVLFASEVKALFTDADVPRRIDPRGLDQIFTYWTSLAPLTPFEGIAEMPPGSVWVYRENRPREEHVVWRPAYPDRSSTFPLTLEGAARELRERLLKATELRIVRADVPVGSYLSGGIDSSLTAWMGRQAKQGDFRTYAIRFADAEFDETPYQRAMAATLESTHEELVVTRGDIARVFPAVIRHTERPVLRTAAAPLFLLSGLVHDSGIKAVLTGEGADEMFGGYDIFREAKIREFWSHQPASTARPRLFDRLYPYLARSPQQARGMALEFWKKGLETAGQPGFSHQPRWSTTAMLKKFFAPQVRDAVADRPAPNVLDSLPPEFARWESLAQAQYLEVVTLLSGYLLSSQGDRMLMAHSVEGRFPFLDAEVMAFANSLPEGYKLAGLTEKAILKRVAADVLPEIIVRRQKQPYRAPDAISFVEPGAPAYVEEVFSESGLRATGLFEPRMVRGLYAKCRERAAEHHGDAVFSNTDNMALVGILSTELLVREVLGAGAPAPVDHVQTMIDRIAVPTHSPT